MKGIILVFLFLKSYGQTSDLPLMTTYHVVPLDSPTTKPNSNIYYDVIPNSGEGLSVIHQKCPDGTTYDGELKNCRSNCAEKLTFSPVTGKCEDDATLKRISDRPTCKNITLDAAFFAIESDGRLRVNGPTTTTIFDRKDYIVLIDGKVTFCFPFTPRLRSCEQWGMRVNEYELRDGGLSLWLIPYETLIDTGDFFITNNKYAAVCVSNSSLHNSPEMMERYRLIDMYATAWTVSAVSIAISLIVYGILNRQMKCHTKILISHMVSFFIFYVTLIFRGWGPEFSSKFCIGYSVTINYFFLTSFFWMNVLAYDIWKHLPRFTTKDNSPTSERNRFLFMSLYAWGSPGLIALTALLVDLFGPEESLLKPNFSQQCWFMTRESKAIFMYGPAAILLSANIVYFVLTIVNLRGVGKDAVLVNKKIHNQLLRMYFKLMVVMGLCWIMEVISSMVGHFNRYWYFTDIINGLQGFFLFLVYVCKPSVLRDLISCWEKRVGPLPFKKLNQKSRFSAPSRENSSTCSTNRENSSNISIIPNSDFGQNTTNTSQISSTSPMPH